MDATGPGRKNRRPRRRKDVDTEMEGARLDTFDAGAERRIVINGAVFVITAGGQTTGRHGVHPAVGHANLDETGVQTGNDLGRFMRLARQPVLVQFETIHVFASSAPRRFWLCPPLRRRT